MLIKIQKDNDYFFMSLVLILFVLPSSILGAKTDTKPLKSFSLKSNKCHQISSSTKSKKLLSRQLPVESLDCILNSKNKDGSRIELLYGCVSKRAKSNETIQFVGIAEGENIILISKEDKLFINTIKRVAVLQANGLDMGHIIISKICNYSLENSAI